MRTVLGKLKHLVFLFALTGSLAAGNASANIIYTFSGVTFDDGGTLSGTFTTNDAINTLVDFDITTAGGVLVGFHYTPGSALSLSSLPFILVVETASLDHILQVTFTGLNNLGSPITIGAFDSFEQDPSGAHRAIVAGEVIVATVPEPSAIVLTSTSLLVLLGFVRRRART